MGEDVLGPPLTPLNDEAIEAANQSLIAELVTADEIEQRLRDQQAEEHWQHIANPGLSDDFE
eukprot:406219-Prorocentrum_lima.AAC.1